jgi:hypothetical protein
LTLAAKIKSPKRLTKQRLFAHLFPHGAFSLLRFPSKPGLSYLRREKNEVAKVRRAARARVQTKMPPSNSIISVSENICARLFGRAVTAALDALCEMSFSRAHTTRDRYTISKPHEFHICAIETAAAFIVKKGMCGRRIIK